MPDVLNEERQAYLMKRQRQRYLIIGRSQHRFMRDRLHFFRIVAITALLVHLVGCTGTREPVQESVTVEGEVTARGQEPFAAYVLVTEGGNQYVLEFDGDEPPGITTPVRLQVTGRLYTAMWDGRPFAHIEVTELNRNP